MSWQDVARLIIEFLNHYGHGGIFLLMFAENLGLPLPTELGFIVGQAMVVSGRASYLSIFLVSLIGKTGGSVLTYFAGRYFADRIRMIRQDSSRLKRAQETFAHWMKKYGDLAVFISRLVGYVRPWSSYLAGIGEIKFLPFFIYNVLGSAVIIVLTMATLGFVVELWRSYVFLQPFIAIIMIILFVGFWFYLALSRRSKKKKI